MYELQDSTADAVSVRGVAGHVTDQLRLKPDAGAGGGCILFFEIAFLLVSAESESLQTSYSVLYTRIPGCNFNQYVARLFPWLQWRRKSTFVK